jgi:DNA sulfur modification protein DndE
LCRSLANPIPPPKRTSVEDSNIDMEWKTFAGQNQEEYAALILLKAQKDGVDIFSRDDLNDYFRDHLERGICSFHNVKDFLSIVI